MQMTEQEIRNALDEKIQKSWVAYMDSMEDYCPDWLFEHAEEIAARRFCKNKLLDSLHAAHTAKGYEYLLRFDDPLEVVSDFWLDEQAVDHSDEFDHALQSILDTSAAEQGYALDPNYSPPERGQTMC
jgi:hypothetical protein